MQTRQSDAKANRLLLSQHTFYTKDDEDFLKQHAKLLYKTNYQAVGNGSTIIKPETGKGLNGSFTVHLANAGMYRNNSLNTTCDRDRYLNGCRDWELKLG